MNSLESRTDLERRLHALEIKMIQVASHAELAWEAEKRRSKAEYDFWWNAYRLVAILPVVLALGLLLFGKR